MQNRKRDTDVQNRLLDSVGEGEGGMFSENSIETSILSRVKQITNPGWMHETSAQGWCTGKTQRNGMEREAGAGIRMGNTCKSMADSCQCMAKTTTKKVIKVISLQLIKIIGKIIVIIKMRKLKPREVKGISLEHTAGEDEDRIQIQAVCMQPACPELWIWEFQAVV